MTQYIWLSPKDDSSPEASVGGWEEVINSSGATWAGLPTVVDAIVDEEAAALDVGSNDTADWSDSCDLLFGIQTGSGIRVLTNVKTLCE